MIAMRSSDSLVTREVLLPQLTFSGHESFPLRYMWLPKGVQGVRSDPSIFRREDATVRLGVGKNMVASIRHWSLATGMIQAIPQSADLRPSDLGALLFFENGLDPYVEDIGTLWLIHWQLVRDNGRASTWHIAFTDWNALMFSRDQLDARLELAIQGTSATRATSQSRRRDIDVFLRSYVAARSNRAMPIEDSFDSPLAELGLIEVIDASTFGFRRGFQPSLADNIFTFAVMDYWRSHFNERSVLSFESLYVGPGSPGSAFKLTENALAERLERLAANSGLAYDDTAGTRVIKREGLESISIQAGMNLLRDYYSQSPTHQSTLNGAVRLGDTAP